jgi:hypothetical protein
MGRRDGRRRLEEVTGRRIETVEWGLRTQADTVFRRTGHVEPRSSLAAAVDARDRPFSGWRGDEQVVTRTVVVYTTEWTVVPGYEGSRWFSCSHEGTPQGRTGKPIMEGSEIRMEGPDYQIPHGFREADMTRGEDGYLRYTCPVCGLEWKHRDTTPQGSLF